MLHLLAHNTPLFITLVAIFSLLVGSFLNVVIHRMPTMLQRSWRSQCREILGLDCEAAADDESVSLLRPRSRCPNCGVTIGALQNIPVISFLLLRGRCASCSQRISIRYPIIEIVTAVLSVVVALQFGLNFAMILALLLTWSLIALSVIDFDHQILPDSITLPGIWVGLLVNSFDLFTDLQSSVIGAAAGYLFLWLVYHIFKLITGKEGMGFGDFKLFALFGAWLGWQALPLIILLSAFAGAVIGIALIVVGRRDRNIPIPFGPYLSVAGWIALLWGEQITRAYLQFVGMY